MRELRKRDKEIERKMKKQKKLESKERKRSYSKKSKSDKKKSKWERKMAKSDKKAKKGQLPLREKRAATARPERIWDYGVIPYEIEANFSGKCMPHDMCTNFINENMLSQ